MKTCPNDERWFLYTTGALPASESEEMRNHSGTCPDCRSRLGGFRDIERFLRRKKRPAPPARLRGEYRRALKQRFGPEPLIARIKNRLSNPGDLLPMARPAVASLARSMAVLMLGVVVGKFILGTPARRIDERHAGEGAPVAQKLALDAFMTRSEIWLLTVANDPRGRDAADTEQRMNRDVARQLLSEALEIEKEAIAAGNDALVRFINQMELLLLEAANADERFVHLVFDDIGRTIRDTKLHLKIRELHTVLDDAAQRI